MRHNFETGFTVRQDQTHEMAALSRLLDLADTALEEYVDLELATNPALVRDPVAVPLASWAPQRPELADVIALQGLEPDPREELRSSARPAVPAADRWLVDLVVDALDDRGRLTGGVADLARTAQVTPIRIARALSAIRANGPPGVGARDLRECLQFQLEGRRFTDDEPPAAVVEAVVGRHLPDLAENRYDQVAAALDCPVGTVRAAAELIRSRLQPFAVLERACWPPGPVAGRALVRPDVLYRAGPDGVRVVLPGPHRPAPTVTTSRVGQRDEDIDRARSFVNRLARRRATVLAVATVIGDHQQDFLLGRGPLQPITQAVVADAAGVDRSTVSRVLGTRWAGLPSGRCIRLREFFDAPPAALTAMRRIRAATDRHISDAEMSRLLSRDGFPVARRTVANYRRRLDAG